MYPGQYINVEWCFWKIAAGILIVLDAIMILVALATVVNLILQRNRSKRLDKSYIFADKIGLTSSKENTEHDIFKICKEEEPCKYGKLDLLCEKPHLVVQTV